MTISYRWLSEYLPLSIEPERLSHILTSIGLEVEKMEHFEEVKGSLQGLLIGQVLEAVQHPNADKLKLTRVDTGGEQPLQIVCGAPNVATGQKVVVAPVGATIYPATGDPLTMKVAKIRGVESYGMICAEDEIGLGTSHAGILVLPDEAVPGTRAADYFQPFSDTIYEIGLTPNRMDAMSHWGVARDVCAYLSHHEGKELRPVLPVTNFSVDNQSLPISVEVRNGQACRRYSGLCIAGIAVGESPRWLQEKLKAIGLRPINNVVDITNFIQHETGQPLHAFDYDTIHGHQVIVQTLPEGTPFITLDEKERKLHAEDLMICDAEGPMTIAGVFGGLHSGVTASTTNVFLESAWFDPVTIRKTSFRHGLRTDAATRFEKGTDISGTVFILERAAALVKQICGGAIASNVVDVYPDPQPKTEVDLRYAYLKKLSGKDYAPAAVKQILLGLGFSIIQENAEALRLQVPYHKRDISMPADIVEEVLRIDGLDNIEIPKSIRISPAIEENYTAETLREKASLLLAGLGYTEILTNSITNSAYFSDEELPSVVHLLNNLSSELNVLRPSMLHTALEVISFNLNRRNHRLRFFEFGKTYATNSPGVYAEKNHLSLYLTGALTDIHWKGQPEASDIYYFKGVALAVLAALGVKAENFEEAAHSDLQQALAVSVEGRTVLVLGKVQPALAARFDIRQPVFFADFYWDALMKGAGAPVQVTEIPKYPAVERDLALVVAKDLPYGAVRTEIGKLRLNKLRDLRLFDVFESDKLGAGKKSLAINLTFLDTEKTLTDKEIDGWMSKIMTTLEKELNAEIRK